MPKSKRTKACEIPHSVKVEVYARDKECSVLSGIWVPLECACCHYIPRSQGGLGIEQNIVTLTPQEHQRYDNSDERPEIRERLKAYLMSKYPNWNEQDLYYKKWRAL